MRVDIDDLRRRYRAMGDEELFATDRADLTEVARECYDEEIAARRRRSPSIVEVGVQHRAKPQPVVPIMEEAAPAEAAEIEPDWLANAGCACSFTAVPGGDAADQAAYAQDILETVGIPSHLSVLSPEPGDEAATRDVLQVMVPGPLLLKATSMLDRDMFNADMEPDWRNHLAELSDAELRLLKPEDICAGLLDRADRLKRVYEEEIQRRASQSLA
jgi:hypothetical protein